MPLTRFEITSRVPYAGGRRFGAAGAYEQVDGAAHFAVDPNHPANALICDLKLAPRNGAGLVEFAADFSVVLPVDARLANGRCIVVAMMNCAPPDAPVDRRRIRATGSCSPAATRSSPSAGNGTSTRAPS